MIPVVFLYRQEGLSIQNRLYDAVRVGHTRMAERLIRWGADMEEVDHLGLTPLMLAVRHDHVPIVRMLLEHGADVHQPGPGDNTPMMMAAANGSLPCMNLLHERGASLDNVLFSCVLHNRVRAAESVLNMGADVNESNELGITALMAATMNANIPMLLLLISKGCRLDARDKYGNTALMYANRHGRHAIARILLRSGASSGPVRLT